MEGVRKGLEGVPVLETSISYIDGDRGLLEYRGIDIKELADLSYEEVSHLLLHGHLPDDGELSGYRDLLRSNRGIDPEIQGVVNTCNFNIEAMGALRTVVSYVSHCDIDLKDNTREASLRKAARLIAVFPTVVAGFQRVREGLDPLEPDPDLSHGANFLYMLNGERPGGLEAEAMEKDFILSAEHELNASTFSARVTASTLSDLHSAVISGINTLNGPLHGGARMKVMEFLDRIPSPEEAEDRVMGLIGAKQRIMGFGHRVYRTHDPRGLIFKDMARRMAEAMGDTALFETAEIIERTVMRELVQKRGKPIYPNVDFYSAVIYKCLRLPPTLATAIFAIGRVSGWAAHIIEQHSDNKLIRPRATTIRS